MYSGFVIVNRVSTDAVKCVSLRSTNGGDDRVRAGDSVQVKTPDRALRVHRFVTHDIGLDRH
jgi:hypothetical protein